MLLFLIGSNLRFAARLRRSRRPLDIPECPLPVYMIEDLSSPCLFGLFRPVVYLTPQAAADSAAREHVLAHELTHYAHRDPVSYTHLFPAADFLPFHSRPNQKGGHLCPHSP